LIPQIIKQSKQLHPAAELEGPKQVAVWWPNSPPFGLKLLWFEITLKILSSDHKKTSANLHT